MITNEQTKQNRKEQINSTLDLISKSVAIICEVSEADFLSNSRVRNLVDARRIAYSLARNYFGFTYVAIAQFYNKNHATIIHQVKQHQQLMDYDKNYHLNYKTAFSFLQNDNGLQHLNDYKEAINLMYANVFEAHQNALRTIKNN